MSSIGQALGGIVGGAIGFFVGGPTGALYGAQIGMSVGGLLDPPQVKGPRLEDLSVQTSTYGAFIPRVYGTVALTGNVFWVQNDTLIEQAKTSSGKGGPELTSYSYYATFAVGLCEGPIAGIRRIWIGGQLWYDAGSNDLDAILASNKTSEKFTFYPGNDTQEADPLIQADRGVADTPAYRGLAYLVFELLPLEKYGNSLMGAQVKVEVATDTTAGAVTEIYRREIPQYVVNFVLPVDPDPANGEVFYVMNFDAGLDWLKYTYQLYRENTYPVTRTIDNVYWTWGEGFSDQGTFIRYSPYYDSFVRETGDEFYTGFSAAVLSSYKIKTIAIGDVVWSLFTSSSGSDATFTVVFCPQSEFQEVKKIQSLTDKYFTLAYDADSQHVVLAVTGYFKIYALETGELVDSVATSFTYINLGSGSVDNGIFWQTTEVGTTRWLYGYSLTTGVLLYSYSWAAPAHQWRGYVVGNLLYIVNEGATDAEKYFAVLRLPDGVVDSNGVALSSIVSAECLKSNILEASDIDVTDLTDTVRGYRVSQQGPLRGGIDPLRKVWPFDARQHGYKIEFVRRGGSSVVTIPAEDLDAREAGQSPGVSVTDVREMDLVLPQKVQVKYLDVVREYDNNEQSDDRPNTDAVNQVEIELPIVLNAEEAKQAASMLLDLGWMERYDVSIVLPPTYQQLEPADPITVNSDNATYNLRLTSVGYLPDGRLECKAKYDAAATYVQVSVADEGQSTGNALALSGPTEYVLLDIPLITDDTDLPGFPIAIAGLTSNWEAGQVYRSMDSGTTWLSIAAGFSPGATIGSAAGILSAHGGTVYDFSSTLTVYLDGGHTLASVTEAQLFAGQNWFAYGVDGRWEIIAARTVTMVDTGIYTLQDFLRGQYGTEWATGLHVGGDSLVLLDSDALRFVDMNSTSIGVEGLYRGVTMGDSLDTDSNLAFTYNGVNLECLSPINVIGTRNNTSNQWTISWTRRSRFSGWRDYVDAPLGEASESYEVDIYSDSTYATVVRTLTSATQTVDYSSAYQTTDFGAAQTTIYYKIYQLSATVGRGYALTGSSTVYGATISLLHMNGTDGATTFTDEKGITWTASGNAQIDTARYKFATAAGLFDRTTDYVTSATDPGFASATADFTWEAWIYATVSDATKSGIISAQIQSVSAPFGLAFYHTNSKLGVLYGWNSHGYETSALTSFTNNWRHVVVQRQSGVIEIYYDGVKQTLTTVGSGIPSTVSFTTTTATIGRTFTNDTTECFGGSIDEVRMVLGAAVYPGNFTPPTSEFTS